MPWNPNHTIRASPIKSPNENKERKKSLVDDLLFQQAAHELLLCSTLKRPPKNKLGGNNIGSGPKAAPGGKREDWSFSFQGQNSTLLFHYKRASIHKINKSALLLIISFPQLR